jgi:hypothetical protein
MSILSANQVRQKRGIIAMFVMFIIFTIIFYIKSNRVEDITFGFVVDTEWQLLNEWKIGSKSGAGLFLVLSLVGIGISYLQFKRGKKILLGSFIFGFGSILAFLCWTASGKFVPFTGILQGAESIIATLDDISVIKIDVRIPEIYLNILKKNLKVKVTTENLNETFDGSIESVSSRVDPSSRSILAQIKIKNSNNKLTPGMLLNTEIIYNEVISLGVPEESVVQQGNTAIVYKVIDNQTVARIEVKTGVRNLGYIQIISGLTEGDQIVVQGVSKVRDKSKIKLISK